MPGLEPYRVVNRDIEVTHALVSPDGYIAKVDISLYRPGEGIYISFGSILNPYKPIQERVLNINTLIDEGWKMIPRVDVRDNELVSWIFLDENRFAHYNLYRLFFAKQSDNQTFSPNLRLNASIREAFVFHMMYSIHYNRARRTHSYAPMRQGALKARVIERLSDALSDMIMSFSHELRSIMETSPQVLEDDATYEPLDMIGSGGLGSIPMQLIMSLTALKLGIVNVQANVFRYYKGSHNPGANTWDFQPADPGWLARELRQQDGIEANQTNDYIRRVATNAQMSKAAKAGIYTWAGVRSHERIYVRSIYRVNGLYGRPAPRMRSNSGVVFPSASLTIDANDTIKMNDVMLSDMYPQIRQNNRARAGGDNIEESTNKYAYNAYTCMHSFVRGHLMRLHPGIQDVEVEVIAPEYPIANPFTVIEQPENSKLPPLMHETRADAIVCGSGKAAANGQLIFVYYMVEYKTLMETHINGPVERILHSGARRQVLHNAILCMLNTGLRLDFVLTVHATRRYKANQQYTAGYIGICAVNYDGLYAQTLVKKLLVSPYPNAKTYYMDQNAFTTSNPVYGRDRDLLPGMHIYDRLGLQAFGNVGVSSFGQLRNTRQISVEQDVDLSEEKAFARTLLIHLVRKYRKVHNVMIYFLHDFANEVPPYDEGAQGVLFGAHANEVSFIRRRYPLKGFNPEHPLTRKRKALNKAISDRVNILNSILQSFPQPIHDRILGRVAQHLCDWFQGVSHAYPVQLVHYDAQNQNIKVLFFRTINRLLNVFLLQHAKTEEWDLKPVGEEEEGTSVLDFFRPQDGENERFLHLSQRGLMSERAFHFLWRNVDALFCNIVAIIIAMEM